MINLLRCFDFVCILLHAFGKNGMKYTSTAMDNLFKCWGL